MSPQAGALITTPTKLTSAAQPKEGGLFLQEKYFSLWTLQEIGIQTALSNSQCQESDLGTSVGRAERGNLETSGGSLGVRLAAGLGEDVRSEWHADAWPLTLPMLGEWDQSLIRGLWQPEGAKHRRHLQSQKRTDHEWELSAKQYML